MHDTDARSRRALARDLRAPSRLAVLDGVRGVCVLAVVGWHVFRVIAPTAGIDSLHVPVVWWPMGTARLGVDAFFVLSGFFVVRGPGRRAWQATRENSASFLSAARDFFRRRALRILPAY